MNVRVKPGAKVEKVVQSNTGLTVYCHARAYDGEANAAVIKLVAKHLGVAKSRVRIVRGAKGRDKVLEVN